MPEKIARFQLVLEIVPSAYPIFRGEFSGRLLKLLSTRPRETFVKGLSKLHSGCPEFPVEEQCFLRRNHFFCFFPIAEQQSFNFRRIVLTMNVIGAIYVTRVTFSGKYFFLKQKFQSFSIFFLFWAICSGAMADGFCMVVITEVYVTKGSFRGKCFCFWKKIKNQFSSKIEQKIFRNIGVKVMGVFRKLKASGTIWEILNYVGKPKKFLIIFGPWA